MNTKIAPIQSVIAKPHLGRWPRLSTSCAIALISSLTACGGGGGGDQSAQPGTGGTGSYASGSISGFGSVIINGIRYDDSAADVIDDDDDSLSRNDLKLGMTIEVEGGAVTAASTTGGLGRAVASAIRVVNEFKGPFGNVSGNDFTMLGQNMKVDAGTIFEGATDLADAVSKQLSTCPFAEVYGYYNAGDQTYTATRFACDDSATEYRLFGPVSNVNNTTFRIHALLVNYNSPVLDGQTLNDGNMVRVRLSAGSYNDASPAGTATRITVRNRQAPDTSKAEVEGLITGRTESSGTVSFSVNGLPVQVGSSTQLEDGLNLAQLQNGVRVEVEGRIVDGVLLAREIELEDDDDLRTQAEKQEFVGLISAAQRVSGGGSFTLTTSGGRVYNVTYVDSALDDDITSSQISNGNRVEVKGTVDADGASISALEIDTEDD